MDTYIPGESIIFERTLTDEDGTVVDLTGLLTIAITIYHRTLKTELKAGTKAGGEIGYYTDGTDGIIEFFIEDGLTAAAAKGVYDFLITTTKTNTDFDDNTKTSKGSDEAFKLK